MSSYIINGASMQINSITNSFQPNFNGITKLKLKDGSTAVLEVLTNDKKNIKSLVCTVWLNETCLNTYRYSWKYGVRIDRTHTTEMKLGKQLGLTKKEAEGTLSDRIFGAYLDDIF